MGSIDYTKQDIDTIESWWIAKSRVNFLAYRKYMRCGMFKDGWFITDLSRVLQNFYRDYKDKKRPVYIINTPPQHGKSFAVTDLISWISGIDPTIKIIYSSYTDRLGKRCNAALQRTYDSIKYNKIFPDMVVSKSARIDGLPFKRNSELIEFKSVGSGPDNHGYFRNTTIGGSITGDTMDIGIIDDPVKGRKEARSMVVSQSVWDWFEDDFDTRLSEYAGILLIMTRWVTHDLAARIKEANPSAKIYNYQAIATHDEKFRKTGEPLFPELKSLEFLKSKKKRTSPEGWESLYQGNPTVTGGNMIKDDWWQWWKVLPGLKYKFITADTAQKKGTKNDYTDFKAWAYGADNNLYCIDHMRAKFDAPELRRNAEIFYKKHDTKRRQLGDPILRGMYIEDKSSGTGLIQELRAKKMKIFEVPRLADKIFRCEDASPYIEAGRVYLNVNIPDIDNTLKEAREFPNGEFDDDIDSVFTAIEVAFINKKTNNSLRAAMEADN